MTSYYVGNFSAIDEAIAAVRGAFVSELGWTADDDGERVWYDASGALGLKIGSFSNTLRFYACTDKYFYNSQVVSAGGINTNIYLDYVKSKSGYALLVGAHSDTQTPLKNGSVIIAETTSGKKIEVFTISNTLIELESGQNASRNTGAYRYTDGSYVSLFKLPSLHGGIFKDVYGVYSFSGSQSNAKVYIDGDFYQLNMNSGSDNARLAVPVSR